MKTISRNLLLMAMAGALAASAAGSEAGDLKAKDVHGGPDGGERLRFPLSDYGDLPLIDEKSAHIEWSATGERLCLWWARDRTARRCPGEWIILNRDGRMITSWTNSIVKPQDALAEFPALSVWFRWREYLTNASACAVDDKGWNLFRASAPRDVGDGLSFSTKIEMVQLRPGNRVVWAKEFNLMQKVYQMGLVSTGTRKNLLLVGPGQEGKMLDTATGEVTASFTYGPIENRKEALKRRKEFRLEHRPVDAFIFWSGSVALDQNLGRVAVASAFEDRRVRVVSLAAPFPLLFEAHADENPCPPPGGQWMAWKVDFVASGKYLVVESDFARQFQVERRPTEIYDTKHWRKVWEIDDLQARSVTVSPDGKTIALIRNNVLELGPFVPQEMVPCTKDERGRQR